MIDFKGEKVSIKKLSIDYKLPWSTIKNRYISGYRDDKLIAERIYDTKFNGELTTLDKIAKDHDLPISLIKCRHAIGLRDSDLVVKFHRGKGSENAATKLDAKKVYEIKILLFTTVLTQREIADMYNIDQSHVSDIKRGKRWKKIIFNIDKIIC